MGANKKNDCNGQRKMEMIMLVGISDVYRNFQCKVQWGCNRYLKNNHDSWINYSLLLLSNWTIEIGSKNANLYLINYGFPSNLAEIRTYTFQD